MSLQDAVLYVAVHRASLRLAQLRPVLARLFAFAQEGGPVRIELYLAPRADSVIVGFTLTEPSMLGMLAGLAVAGDLQVIDPERLSASDRSRFLTTVHTRYARSETDASDALAAFEKLIRPARSALGTLTPEDPETMLVVRFRRGDAWQLGRLRSLVGAEMNVTTSTPPQAGSTVEVRFGAGAALMTLPARLSRSTTSSGAESADGEGATGFTATLLIGSAADAEQLDAFLRLLGTRASHVLGAAPKRRETRYPVCWPVTLLGDGRALPSSALDLSLHGMFVTTETDLVGTPIAVEVPIDDGGRPLRQHTRVARTLAPALARTRGLTPGIGLELGTLAPRDHARFTRFVQRIARRAQSLVLVAATSERAAPIMHELVAAGYSAAHVPSPDALVDRVERATRPPELVLLDPSLTRADRAIEAELGRLLCERGVNHARIAEDAPGDVRALADLTLLA